MLTTTHAKVIEYAENLIKEAAEAAYRGKCLEKAVSLANKDRVFAKDAPEDLFLLRSPAVYRETRRCIDAETLIPMRASNILAHIIVEEAVKIASNNENAVPALADTSYRWSGDPYELPASVHGIVIASAAYRIPITATLKCPRCGHVFSTYTYIPSPHLSALAKPPSPRIECPKCGFDAYVYLNPMPSDLALEIEKEGRLFIVENFESSIMITELVVSPIELGTKIDPNQWIRVVIEGEPAWHFIAAPGSGEEVYFEGIPLHLWGAWDPYVDWISSEAKLTSLRLRAEGMLIPSMLATVMFDSENGERDIKTYSVIENPLLEEIREKVREILKAEAVGGLSKPFI